MTTPSQEQKANNKAVTFIKKAARYCCFSVKKLWKWLLLLLVLMVGIDLGTSYLVKDQVYTNIEQLPKREYAVVLGTAKYYPSGAPNLYYKYRLEAAKSLFSQQKVDYFLMSGDNKTAYYNEPKMMSSDLLKMGVSAEAIKQDYAGYSTLDSILRADKVFQLKPFTIVSQQFHCERALLIARFHRINAICFAAKYPENHYRVRIREFFARTAMVLSLFVGVEPSTLEESRIVK